ncbi:type II/IV secretion system ATPase subunit [Candidatus Micrarchaeota archaeon]|nr:type II/IV secretion system ATPase subunit [Candidatus Micrarchaeota archaeon]
MSNLCMVSSVVKSDGGLKRLVMDFRGSPYGPDIAQYGQAMQDVLDKLREVDVDEVVLTDYYERIYDQEQTSWLKEIADVITKFEIDSVWSPTHLGSTLDSVKLGERHDAVLAILNNLRSDPFKAYLNLVREIKEQNSKVSTIQPEEVEDEKVYLKTLNFMRDQLEGTKLIQKMKVFLAQLNAIPTDRGLYHSLFEVSIKPSFIGSRIFFKDTEKLELVDQYQVSNSEVFVYKHPEKVEYLYFINPPEYSLPPDKYFLLEKTKEIVSSHRAENVEFLDITQARKYFRKIYVATISDLATKNNIKLSVEEKEDLAEIVSRYTIGYGILEILLSDRALTDIYIDSPLGEKPVYLVHSKYGQCQTNIIFSFEEARSIVSRFRALSGRPFDEAHPILDFDLPDLQVRVAVIGKPLALDGTAFAFRLHKTTPWTLAQFLDQKMFTPITAGLLSFFVDAQASMLIVGSRGAGKTSLLQAMMLEIPQNLRIIVQEDTQELPVPSMKKLAFNIQRMKTRPPLGGLSESEVSAEDALRTALRLGDSVLIVGEVRSTEARALYEAMRVGAVGNVVMGTIHGESAYSIWDRVVNDLGVPTTSFKATDFAIVAAPIRFKGSLQRTRRLIEITEVLKEWNEDPLRENGFLNWAKFDANTDELELFKDDLKKSSWLQRIQRNRGLNFKEVWSEVEARAESKQYLVELKRELDLPELLEASSTLRAHTKYLLLSELQRREYGKVDHASLLEDWKAWCKEVLVKDVQAERAGTAKYSPAKTK